MRGVEIHDRHSRGFLAFDLRHIVQCLREAVYTRTWTCSDVDCTGDAHAELTALSDSGASIAGSQLADLASRVHQVIDGEFRGTLPGENRPSLVIKAVDSTLWVVHGDEACIDEIRRAFADVRPTHYHGG
jgi:hypothetical protein